jgi:hypothetical protein
MDNFLGPHNHSTRCAACQEAELQEKALRSGVQRLLDSWEAFYEGAGSSEALHRALERLRALAAHAVPPAQGTADAAIQAQVDTCDSALRDARAKLDELAKDRRHPDSGGGGGAGREGGRRCVRLGG